MPFDLPDEAPTVPVKVHVITVAAFDQVNAFEVGAGSVHPWRPHVIEGVLIAKDADVYALSPQIAP
jgi:hypothetical protein